MNVLAKKFSIEDIIISLLFLLYLVIIVKEREVKNRVVELFNKKGYDIHFCKSELTLSDEVKIDFLATNALNGKEKEIIIVETKGDTPGKRFTEQLRIQKEYAHYTYLAIDAESRDHYIGGVLDQQTGLILAYPHEAKIDIPAPKNVKPSKLHFTKSKIEDMKPYSKKELLEITCPIPDVINLILRFKSLDYPEFDKIREEIRCSFFTGLASLDYSLISNALVNTLNFSYNVTDEMRAVSFFENFIKHYSWRKIIAEYKEHSGEIPSIGKSKGKGNNIVKYYTKFQECLETYIDAIFQGIDASKIDLNLCDKNHFMFYYDTLRSVCFNAEKGFDSLYEKLSSVKHLGGLKLSWFLINLSLDTIGLLPIRVTEKVPISDLNDKSPQIVALKNLGLLSSDLKGPKAVQQYRFKVKEIADLIGISPKIIDIKLWWAQKDGFLGK